MSTLTFIDPREVAAYWDRFEDRSITSLQPYLWENPDSDNPTITRVRREELDMMVVDEKTEVLKIDAAVYVAQAWQETGDGRKPLPILVTHSQSKESEHPWDTEILLKLKNKIEVDNLIKQIAGEASRAFSVVESS